MRVPLNEPYQHGDGYGWRTLNGKRQFHHGADLNGVPIGRSIYPCNDGTVVFAGWHVTFGWCVVVDHHDGYQSLYGHMNVRPVVKKDDRVSQITRQGGVGDSGYSFGAHLHWGVFKGVFNANNLSNAVNPYDYIARPAPAPTPTPTPAPTPQRKLRMHEALLVNVATNKLLIVNMKDKTIIDLGNDGNSAVRKYYTDNYRTTYVGEPEWTDRFKGYTYI